MSVEINTSNFESEVLKSSVPVLVDFWADWCMPCKMLTPVIDELQKEFDGKANVVKVNVDDNQELAAEYNVMSIPTVLLFKDGAVVEQFIGVQPRTAYVDAINKHL